MGIAGICCPKNSAFILITKFSISIRPQLGGWGLYGYSRYLLPEK
nr:MAG TPA: hypothetical protein [Bacteriophage sp.]